MQTFWVMFPNAVPVETMIGLKEALVRAGATGWDARDEPTARIRSFQFPGARDEAYAAVQAIVIPWAEANNGIAVGRESDAVGLPPEH